MTQDRTHALVLALSLSLITASYLPNVVADPDLWGHTKFGIDHIQSGRLAKTDPFSYTPAGQEWVNHEWLDMIISETGEVEHVKLISIANRFQERMIVAAAKAWRFRPALKGGQPVKYRIRVRVTL